VNMYGYYGMGTDAPAGGAAEMTSILRARMHAMRTSDEPDFLSRRSSLQQAINQARALLNGVPVPRPSEWWGLESILADAETTHRNTRTWYDAQAQNVVQNMVDTGMVSGTGTPTPTPTPSGPGSKPGVDSTVVFENRNRNAIMALQQEANASNCNAGTVDGVWGPATARGADCLRRRIGAAIFDARFPFAQALMTGAVRPPTGQPTAGGGEGGPSGRREEGPSGRREEASIFGALPWWGWLGIAGGVGLLALIGVAIYKSGEEDEEMFEEIGRDRLGY